MAIAFRTTAMDARGIRCDEVEGDTVTAARGTTDDQIQIRTAHWTPVIGPIAVAQALGAPDATAQRHYWNAPEPPGFEPGSASGVPTSVPLAKDRLFLGTVLGTEPSAPAWFDGLDAHLRGRIVNGKPGEKALDVREDVLDHRPDSYLDINDWLTAISETGEREQWAEADVDKVCAAAVKAFHIERQLTEDGLLPAGMRVWTYMAHDLGAAVYLVQTGFRMGYANGDLASATLTTAATNAANIFGSWAHFGASWVAARSAFYGSYPSDSVWRNATTIVSRLLSDPQSPWTNLPFPADHSGPAGPTG